MTRLQVVWPTGRPTTYGELGEVAYDPDEDKVRGHLCGRGSAPSAGSHLCVHGWNVERYRRPSSSSPRLPRWRPAQALCIATTPSAVARRATFGLYPGGRPL